MQGSFSNDDVVASPMVLICCTRRKIEKMKIYFDKNVLSHLISAKRGAAETNGVTKDDVKVLCEAVASGKITNVLSTMHLQEAAYALRAASPRVAAEELSLIQDLMDTTRIIKPSGDMLIDDIISYARGEALGSPLLPFTYKLEDLFSFGGDIEERMKALDDTDKQNHQFVELAEAAKDNDRAFVLQEFGGERPDFEEFFAQKIYQRIINTIDNVEKRTGSEGLVDACKSKGIEGMVRIPSLFLAEGVGLSYQYARIFDEISNKQKRRRGDPSDLKHALSASACDLLITHDSDFFFWMNRIPDKPIQLLDHVHKLIEAVG